MITTQTLPNLSLAVIQVENSSPAETPPMLSYKAALSLRKKKTLYCKAALRPTCQLTVLQPMGIRNYQTPPPPKEGELGYGAYMDRMATGRKGIPPRTTEKMRGVAASVHRIQSIETCSFTTNEPHPIDDVLCSGSSGMMVTSGLTPNGQQSYNPYVPLTTESMARTNVFVMAVAQGSQ